MFSFQVWQPTFNNSSIRDLENRVRIRLKYVENEIVQLRQIDKVVHETTFPFTVNNCHHNDENRMF